MPKQQKDFLALYSRDCLSCHHLIDGALPKARRCHLTHGNRACPAGEVRIIITGKLLKYANDLVRARAEQDLDAEVRILQAIGKESEDSRKTFYRLLDQAMAKSPAKS